MRLRPQNGRAEASGGAAVAPHPRGAAHAAARPAAPRAGAPPAAGQQHAPGGAPPPPPPPALPRRAAVALLAGAPLAAAAAAAAAAGAPPPPGDLGEVQGTLNDCPLGAVSCASSMSDDDDLFYAPWEYEGPRGAAVAQLVQVRARGGRVSGSRRGARPGGRARRRRPPVQTRAPYLRPPAPPGPPDVNRPHRAARPAPRQVATGGEYDPGFTRDAVSGAVGISRGDAAAFIVGTTLSTLSGRPPPARPRAARRAAFRAFDGVLQDRHTAADGSEYVWVTFGLPAGDDGDGSSSSSSSSDDEAEAGAGGAPASAGAAAAAGPSAPAAAAAAAPAAAAASAGTEGAAAGGAVAAEDDGSSSSSSSTSSSSDDEAGAAGAKGARRRGARRGGGGNVDPASIIDAEFIFPPGGWPARRRRRWAAFSAAFGAGPPPRVRAGSRALPLLSRAPPNPMPCEPPPPPPPPPPPHQHTPPPPRRRPPPRPPTGDNIVNVRAAARAAPGVGGGRLALSFEQGVVFDRWGRGRGLDLGEGADSAAALCRARLHSQPL
jgi:hypothetical protein